MAYKTAKQLVDELEKKRNSILEFSIWFHKNIYYFIPEENLYYFNNGDCYGKDDLFNMFENYILGYD